MLQRVWGVVAICGLAVALTWQTVPAQETAIRDAGMRETQILEQLKYLADDEREGRAPGTKGLDQAAEFIRQDFAKAGLDVTQVNGGAFQTFDMVSKVELGSPNTLTLTGPEGRKFELVMGKDFEVCSFGASGSFSGEVVFAGYGIDAPKDGYSDYEGLDVAGKVVIVMRRNPGQADAKNPHAERSPLARFADLRSKYREAAQRKAAAILLVNDPYSSKESAEERQRALRSAEEGVVKAAEKFIGVAPEKTTESATAREELATAVTDWKDRGKAVAEADNDPLMKFGYAGNGDDSNTMPAVHVRQSVVNQMLAVAVQKSLADLEKEIDADTKPHSLALPGWTASGETQLNRIKTNISNVIGVLEGEGPHADETIVIGAHYDHVGRGGANSLSPGSKDIHNGADDNASGTVALLDLARRLGDRKEKLPRRVVFIAFTAEELGLIGSAYYVNHPVFPLEKTVAMFNMDMVGRLVDEKLTIFGSGTSKRWEPELKPLVEEAKFAVTYKPEGFGPSDHSSFYGKKIPVLHFFTGTHPDYHRPTDDWEKINIGGIARITGLIEQMVVATAENPERPDYVEVDAPQTAMRSGSRPYVGTIPDFSNQEPGYGISGASPGSPADKAGMKASDLIVQLGDDEVKNLEDFDLALRKHKAGDEVVFVVKRGGQRVPLKVKLEPPR